MMMRREPEGTSVNNHNNYHHETRTAILAEFPCPFLLQSQFACLGKQRNIVVKLLIRIVIMGGWKEIK